MNLDSFLSKARDTGHARYRLASLARGHELARGLLTDATGDELTGLAREDAVPLARETQHEYVLTVESEDGAKASRFTIRVPGGAAPLDEHRVDPDRAQTPAAVIGHLTRLVVEQHKQVTQLVSKVLDRDIAETAELGKLRRSLAKRGDTELTAMMLQAEQEEKRADRERSSALWSRLFELATPVALKLLPGGPASALDRFRASVTERQAEALCAIVGPGVFAAVMAAKDPGKLAGLLLERVTPAMMQQLQTVLTEEQRAVLGAALSAEIKRREAEMQAAAAKDQAAQ